MTPRLAIVDSCCDAWLSSGIRCSSAWVSVRVTRKGHAHVCSRHAKVKRLVAQVQRPVRKRLHTEPIPRHGCDACAQKAVAA